MRRYLLRRLGQGVLTVFLITTTVFVLIRLAPGDPAYARAGSTATPAQLEEVRHEMGLDQSIAHQYLVFLRDLLHGDVGTSFSYQHNALAVVLQHLPYTLTLAFASILLTILVSIPVGVAAARRPSGAFDSVSNVVTILGLSIPEFWVGIMLVIVFAVHFGIFPTYGYTGLSSLVLPAVTVAIAQIAVVSRVVRREMVNNLAAPYVTLARARGVGEASVVWRHAFSNAGLAVTTVVGTRFAAMLNGVVVVEVVFSWPGVGSLVVRALETSDYPLIVATVLVTSTLAIAVQLLVDCLYPLLDRRVRLVA